MQIPFIGKIIEGVTNYAARREERKIAKITGQQKIAEANADAENKLVLTDAEWESLKVRNEDNSWKDEFVTVVITAPIWLIILGAILAAFGMGEEVLNGTVSGITALKSLGVDMGFLMEAVVMAAVGLKVWRSR